MWQLPGRRASPNYVKETLRVRERAAVNEHLHKASLSPSSTNLLIETIINLRTLLKVTRIAEYCPSVGGGQLWASLLRRHGFLVLGHGENPPKWPGLPLHLRDVTYLLATRRAAVDAR